MAVIPLKIAKPQFEPFEVTCNRCDQPLRVTERDDVKTERVYDEGQSRSFDSLYIVCPVCGHKVLVPYEAKEKILKNKSN